MHWAVSWGAQPAGYGGKSLFPFTQHWLERICNSTSSLGYSSIRKMFMRLGESGRDVQDGQGAGRTHCVWWDLGNGVSRAWRTEGLVGAYDSFPVPMERLLRRQTQVLYGGPWRENKPMITDWKSGGSKWINEKNNCSDKLYALKVVRGIPSLEACKTWVG